jgi:hypothetical protein
MQQKIVIDEPCPVVLEKRDEIPGGWHCKTCKLKVHDFTKSSFGEIAATIKSGCGQRVCGRYHDRHVAPEKKVWKIFNSAENFLVKRRMKKVAFFVTVLAILFSSCARKSRSISTRQGNARGLD